MYLIFILAFHLSLLYLGEGIPPRVIKTNVIALEVNGNPMEQKTLVSLHCGDQYENTEIHWQRNSHSIPLKGNTVTITVEAMLGGNFTCHAPSGEVLNHTLVLIRPLDFEKAILTRNQDGEFLSCLARNYSGSFHCSWKWDPIRNGAVVFFKALRNMSHINCTLDSDNTGLTCEEMQCPFSEEVSRINLTLLVRNQYRLEEHQQAFFIYDIIKPDRVNITRAENDEFEWEVPQTWNSPCSYFPLRYEVKVVSHRKDCDTFIHDHHRNHEEVLYTNKTIYEVSSKKSYTFCVRAQDYLTNQAWSEWSQLKVIKQKSKK